MKKIKLLTMALLPISTVGATIGMVSCSATKTKLSLEDVKVSLYFKGIDPATGKDKWEWGEFKLSQVNYVTFGVYNEAGGTLQYVYDISLKPGTEGSGSVQNYNNPLLYSVWKTSYENYKTAQLYWMLNNR